MNSTYAQKSSTVQKAADTKAASVLDSSAQSESLQRKADMANAAQRAEAPRPNNTGMPDNLKAGIESLSGFSMDNVRVHYNSSKPATVQALAYTQGTDIHVAPGQEKCLPHEAWHVAQQMAGRVSPTTNINGMPVNDNAALEHEADVMGEKAVQCKMVGASFSNGKLHSSAVQRMAFYNPDTPNETSQIERDEDLANIFGRKRYVMRPDNVARYVDQFKKEMLTYIASCIADCEEENFYGPHISIIITGGVWYVAINSDYVNLEKDVKNKLFKDAYTIQNEIVKRWDALNKKADFIEQLKCESSEVPDDIAKKQALYIVYRWAGKGKGVVVEQNEKRHNGVMHGEMETMEILNNKGIAFRKAALCFENVKGKFLNSVTENSINLASAKAFSAAYYEEKAQIAKRAAEEADEKDNVESDAENKANVAAYYAIESAKDAKIASDEARKNADNIVKFAGDKTEVIESYRKLKSACSIIDFQMKSDEIWRGVVRVGGTKTPCYDCAYEMHIHEDEYAEKEIVDAKKGKSEKAHLGHQAENIGRKKAVTMTSEYGDSFANWCFLNAATSCTYKGDLLPRNSDQDQDYNELYDTFNSLDMADNSMKITNSMLNVWRQRRVDLAFYKGKDPLSPDMGKKELFVLKNKLVHHLEKIYVKKNNENVDFLDEKNFKSLNEMINDYNSIKNEKKLKELVKNERYLIKIIDDKIQTILSDDIYDNYANVNAKNNIEITKNYLKDLQKKMNNVLAVLKKICDLKKYVEDNKATIDSLNGSAFNAYIKKKKNETNFKVADFMSIKKIICTDLKSYMNICKESENTVINSLLKLVVYPDSEWYAKTNKALDNCKIKELQSVLKNKQKCKNDFDKLKELREERIEKSDEVETVEKSIDVILLAFEKILNLSIEDDEILHFNRIEEKISQFGNIESLAISYETISPNMSE